jgi:nucleoside-diphosphate-sugar epimerase
MGQKEEAVGEAINLGSGEEHRVIDLANKVNELAGQTLRKFNHQTFKKGLIQTNAFRKSLIKNSNKMGNWADIEGSAEF